MLLHFVQGQRHTVSESTAMSFIPRQYSWYYTGMNMSVEKPLKSIPK